MAYVYVFNATRNQIVVVFAATGQYTDYVNPPAAAPWTPHALQVPRVPVATVPARPEFIDAQPNPIMLQTPSRVSNQFDVTPPAESIDDLWLYVFHSAAVLVTTSGEPSPPIRIAWSRSGEREEETMT
jgi:hypothetical protein